MLRGSRERPEAMKRQIEPQLSRALVRWVDAVRTRAQLIVIACLVLTAVCLGHTLTHLGINADNVSLLPERLPSRQAHERFIEHFPNLEAANAAFRLVKALTGAEVLGPFLVGLEAPVNILPRGVETEDLVGMAAITAALAFRRTSVGP